MRSQTWKSDIINDILNRAGISKEHEDWGEQFNLCYAAFDGLGIRNGSVERVKTILRQTNLTPFEKRS